MAINFSAQFIVNEKTSTRVLRLTDTSTGFTLSKGNFIITFPDGTQVANTDFANPQITAPGGNTSISLITDVDNTVLTGTYVITYVALNTSLNEFTKTETFDFNWEKPAKAIINDSDVVLPEVQFKDLTAYETSGSFAGTLTRNFYTTTPSTSEVGVITKTSVGDILTPVNASKYYEGIYLVKSDISVAYTHTSKSWLTIAYTDLLEETFDVREAPTQDELVALMNTYKDQIEAYKSTNSSQYEIMNEQYDLVLALYSHILARYQTNTLDGSKAILDQLLGLLPPASSYTYKATQMLPFTINFSTSLTGTGTTGSIPKFTGTATLGDSIIKEDTNRIGIGKTPTTTLDVNGTIKGTSIVRDGGISTQFLKADGSIDANTYLTTGSASSTYQPLDADLTAIAVLAGAAGILTKVSANTWTLDTTSYQVLDADLTAIAALAGTSGLLRKTSANTWELDTTSYQVLDADLTAIAALTGTSGILIKTAANTWSLDTATYQLADADLTAIAALAGTSGLIRKTAANTYELDTSAYLTGINSGQITTALGYTPENAANKGVNNGYAGLDGSGKVPSTQLPSYVDDVLEYANVAALPATGETGKIYITLDTNKIYRWSGSVYVEISSSTAVWGGITGTLANQTDLQEALDAKLNITTAASTYVPYTGATANVDLGTHTIIAAKGTFSSSGSGDTVGITHSSGSGIALNIIKAGNNEGLYINKTSGSGNAATIIGTLNATTLVKSGGTSSQFLKADGSVDENTYASTTQLALKADIANPVFTDNIYISGTNPRLYFTDTNSNPDYTIFIDEGNFYILNQTSGAYKLLIQETGNISAGVGNSMIATSFIRRGGTSDEFLMADGSVTTGAVFNYPAIGIAVSGGGGWLTSIDDNSVNWNAAYSARISSLTTTGNSGAATLASNVLNIPNYTIAGLGGQPAFTSGTGFVKISGTTISYVDETYYLASNPSGYITSSALAPYLLLSGGTLTGALGGTSATFSGDVTAASFIRTGGTSAGFLKADGSVDIRTFVTTGALDNYLPLTGGSLTNSLSSGYVLSVTNTTESAGANGLYVNIASGSTGTPFRVDRGGVSLITVNYLGATLFKSTITANQFIKANGTSSEYLMADGSVSTGMSFTYPGAGIVVSTGTAWGTSITDNSSNWNTAYSSRITSATAPLNITGTTISISQAGASANGFLSSTDWNTFNNKASTASLGNYLPLSGGTLTGALSGTSATFSGNISSGSVSGTSGYRLKVEGLARFEGANTVLNYGELDASNVYFQALNTASNASKGFVFYGTGEYMRITSAGNVGIGTNTPSAKLSLYDTSDVWVNIARGSSFVNVGVDSTGTFYNTNSNHRWLYNSGSNEAMRITSAGNLLLGTTSSVYRLSVVGSGGTNQPASFASSDTTLYTAYAANGSDVGYIGNGIGLVSGGVVGNFGVRAENNLFFAISNAERMRITSAGNVGIGTTSPGAKLDIAGGDLYVRTGGALYANTYSPYSGNMTIALGGSGNNLIVSGGNVGIGTTSPGAKLEVIGDLRGGSYGLNSDSVFRGGLYPYKFISGSGSDYGVTIFAEGGTGNGNIYFCPGGSATQRMTITSGGELAIGMTSSAYGRVSIKSNSTTPYAGFNVYATGNGNFTYMNHDNNVGIIGTEFGVGGTGHTPLTFQVGGSERMRITSGGNVLIGTTTDSGYKLNVNGQVIATAYFESSDKKLKQISYLQDSNTFGAIQFNWKDQRDEKNHWGYIAQDVAKFIPDAVSLGGDGFLAVDYNQAHTFKIAKVEDEVALLKRRVKELEAQLNLN